MAFGEGFKHVETFEQLEDGYYRAKIIKAEIKHGNYGDYAQAEVEIEGHPKANPHIFLLNDSPKSGFGNFSLEQAQEMWCRTMSQFFASFGIPEGDFEPSHWVGTPHRRATPRRAWRWYGIRAGFRVSRGFPRVSARGRR